MVAAALVAAELAVLASTSAAPATAHVSTAGDSERVTPGIAGGTPIMDAATSAPWVVSIWHSRDGSFPDFICTGTVISPDEIVAAAHCVQQRDYYYVSAGANELGNGDRVSVEAIVSSRRYSAKTLRNDVAVMRPLEPIVLPSYPGSRPRVTCAGLDCPSRC